MYILDIGHGRKVWFVDAHMKRQIMCREVVVAITDGRLDFGTWEQNWSLCIPEYGSFHFRCG